MLRPLLCLVILTICPSLVGGTELTGEVRDGSTTTPLSGANLVVRCNGAERAATTSLEGRFRVRDLAPGVCAVTASFIGFESQTVTLSLAAAGHELTISLSPVALALNPRTVSASRGTDRVLSAPATVSMVTSDQIRSRPTLSPTEHVAGLPGVDLVTFGLSAGRVVVRGFNTASSSRLLILADHRVASIPSLRINVPQLLSFSDADIERIEVVSGPVSAVYGPNAVGGAMNVIRRSALERQGTSIELGVGQRDVFTSSVRHARRLTENLGFDLSLMHQQGRDWAFKDPAEPDSIVLGVRTPEGRTREVGPISNKRDLHVSRQALDGRFDWAVARDTRVSLAAGLTRWSGTELTVASPFRLEDWGLWYVQGRVQTDRLFAQSYVNVSDAGDSYDRTTGDLLIDTSVLSVTQVHHSTTLWNGRQRFTYGGDLFLTRPRTGRVSHGRNEDDDDVDEIGAFLQSHSRLTPHVEVFATARVDHNSRLPDNTFSPRLGLVYRPLPNHRVRATFNRAFDSPVPNLLFLDVVGAPSIGPLPYALRIRGVPPATGYTFVRDDAGGVDGLYMQSPFTPAEGGGRSAYVPADATTVWNGLVDFSGLELSAVPAPNASQVASTLAALAPTGGFVPFAAEAVTDIPQLEPLRSTTYEIGYSGVVGERLLLTANGYREQNSGFADQLLIETPSLFLDETSLAAYLAEYLPETQATAAAAQLASLPAGTVTPLEADAADILMTARNVADITVYGLEMGVSWFAPRGWTLHAGYDHVSRNFFPARGNQPHDRALNAPKDKVSLSATWSDGSRGLHAGLRLRYIDDFPVVSGLGTGRIPAYTVVDLNGVLPLPIAEASLALSVQNLFDNRHREYLRAPKIGRLVTVRLRYHLPVDD